MSATTQYTILINQPKLDLASYQGSLLFLFQVNLHIIQTQETRIPNILGSCIYKPDDFGNDQWINILELSKRKVGDCEDIACGVAAQMLLHDNVDCEPYVYQSSEVDFHVVIKTKLHGLFDPCKLMGMR